MVLYRLLQEEVAQKLAELATKSKSNFEILELIKILTKWAIN